MFDTKLALNAVYKVKLPSNHVNRRHIRYTHTYLRAMCYCSQDLWVDYLGFLDFRTKFLPILRQTYTSIFVNNGILIKYENATSQLL